MAISLSASSLNIPSATPLVKTTTNVAKSAESSAVSLAKSETSTQKAGVGIQPAPVVKVNQQGNLQSPFIKITQQSAENANINVSSSEPPANLEPTNQLIQELSQQQSEVRARKESLEAEQVKVENEISQLRKRESEINQKKFQLRRQSSVGSIINLKT